jgi:UPF0755 protein
LPRVRIIVVGFGLIVASVLGFAAYVVHDLSRGAPATGGAVRVTVAPGAAFQTVVRDLVEAGLVRRAWTLEFFAKATGQDRRVQRGTYAFAPGTPALAILRRLVAGDVLSVRVTVPEGFTMWQIAAAFAPAGVDSSAMIAAARDPDLVRALKVPTATLEGYLFPDTYEVPFGSDARDIAAQMLTRFHAAWTTDFERRCGELGMTRHQILTLASIVEAEARVPDERPLVAAVYHNRLRRGMKLDADPTVAYAMGGFRGRLYYKDLAVDSPYNTYRRAGLPPGPIGNPGEGSIRAALYPDPEVRALYFVARGDGRHEFSDTLKEHTAAVARSRQRRDVEEAKQPR